MTIKIYIKGRNVALSDHFNSTEFDCPCSRLNCTKTLIDDRLIKLLELFRIAIGGLSIKINSGFRCPGHNIDVGGETASQHLLGTAADIARKDRVLWSESERLFAEEVCKKDGLGTYITPGDRFLWFHFDSRGSKARWEKKI